MPNIIETMKKAALDAVKSSKPCEIQFGTLLSVDPISVQISQKIVLTRQMLILPARISELDLKVDDRLVLFRQQGGQKYLIFDKVVPE